MKSSLKRQPAKKQGSTLFAIIFGIIAILGLMSILSPSPDAVTSDSVDGFGSRGTYTGYLFKVVAVTITMVIILIVGLRIYKKQLGVKGKNNLNLSVLGRHYINDKQYLLKVSVEDKYMLLGVSDSNINYITELSGPSDEDDDEQASFGTILDLETNEERPV